MHSMTCRKCGKQLASEAFVGPPHVRWATEGIMSVQAARHGWQDGTCHECITAALEG